MAKEPQASFRGIVVVDLLPGSEVAEVEEDRNKDEVEKGEE